jgi:hypothetical protein
MQVISEESEMKVLKSALVVGSWLVLSTAYAQSGPDTETNAPVPSQDAASAAVDQSSQAPRPPQNTRKTDECVGPASYCTVFFGGS